MDRIKLASMRSLLLFLIILVLLKPAESANGVIWDKKSGTFVPIFSIPSFAAWNQEVLRKSREQETHNFQGKTIRFSYYEMTNLVNTEENGTKVSGAIGEVWNILADHLNFTLQPVLSEENTVGALDDNGDFSGLLQDIQSNKSDVIPRTEPMIQRHLVVHFTLPFWKAGFRLYIRREDVYESYWMLTLFSLDLWHAILWIYFLISACSYVSQIAGIVLTRQKFTTDVSDHLFYNFGMIFCDQSFIPEGFSLSSCIVEFCLGIFSLLIRTAFSAFVFEYLSQLTTSPPFHDIETLLDRTSYKIAVLSNSSPHLLIENQMGIYARVYEMNRYVAVPTTEDLYTMVCSANEQYAIYEADDIKKAAGLYICPLNPVSSDIEAYRIESGVTWNFEYMRTIDLTILKLHETGILRLLRERWIESKNVEEEVEPGAEPINMTEVYLIICVFGVGWLIAVLVFILEKMTFMYYNKHEPIRHISLAKNIRRDHKSTPKIVSKPTRRRIKRVGMLYTRRSGSFRS